MPSLIGMITADTIPYIPSPTFTNRLAISHQFGQQGHVGQGVFYMNEL